MALTLGIYASGYEFANAVIKNTMMRDILKKKEQQKKQKQRSK